ncbi:hypothetical protein [Dictyobacter aurantiacus]|uniref:Uncharacterized protein n=1 Tax=Dictyobacter aurantiacus TaxID=1936993 RepID=A0A401ZJ69_9CHLR|nr:hypothetical protein [Dictyobacter aurantiacus]GCE06874.1 hypothetical protein KDAU_42030 [Dictyobacter aurantiacus]
MSENFLRLIPIDPQYVPSQVAQYQVKSLLASFLPEKEIQVKLSEEVAFIDAGNNLELIQCPACEAPVSCEWWSAMMDHAYASSHFLNLNVTMPCCATMVSLNNLHYMWPVGFARFVIEIRAPERGLAERLQPLIQPMLGCPIRKIHAHY